jgi:NADH-quinone oxidoreductase subunit N
MFTANFASIFIGPLLPEVTLALGGMILLILGAFINDQHTNIISRLSLFLVLIALVILTVFTDNSGGSASFAKFFVNNKFVILSKTIILLATSLVMILYIGTRRGESHLNNFEFPILMLFSVIGMMLMVSSNDFITLYLGLELQSLCLYVLASYERENSRSSEAGLKYFILGALSSGIMLYGISLIYGFTATTNFNELLTIFNSSSIPIAILIGFVMVIVGFCFKLGAAPFHMWTPDVYEGSPTIVTAFFSMVPKAAAITILARFLINPFGAWVGQWQQIFIFISILSMFVGALGAIRQTNIKRLLAYSSIGHVGYMLIGIISCNINGIKSVLIYIFIYIIMSLGIFVFIMRLHKKNVLEENISSFAGLSIRHPVLAFSIAVLMFSMAGIPPLAGFLGKFYIFVSAIEANLYSLAVAGLISSVIAAYYYLKIVKIMYFDEVNTSIEVYSSKEMTLLFAAAIIFNLLFMFLSERFVTVANNAAKALFV